MADLSRDVLRIVGAIAVRQIQRRIRQGKVTPKTGKRQTTLVKRGMLLRSIKYEIRGDTVVISAGGANVPYARIQHEGGVIRPKTAKYLAIPLTSKAELFKPRDFPGKTFIAKGVIFLDEGEGKKPIPIYALKKQVTIPKREYMVLDEGDKNLIRDAVQERIEQSLKVEQR